MQPGPKILIVHTAFMGDVMLALPIVQILRRRFPGALIDFVAIPASAAVLRNHPAVSTIIEYDKRGRDKGIRPLLRMCRSLSGKKYDIAIIPHRSIRSALIGLLSRIQRRIGFSTSAGRALFTDVVMYDSAQHEVVRNLDLLSPFGGEVPYREIPRLFPSQNDVERVDTFLLKSAEAGGMHYSMVAIAPGSVWKTKRWLPERFADLARTLVAECCEVVLIGGKEDAGLCEEIASQVSSPHIVNAAGVLTPLQSAELIRRCKALVTNDSAPLHMGVAVRTPVIAIFGATVPEFGFGPLNDRDIVLETKGLTCRPCGIHGGNKCPVKTFDCMQNITAEQVLAAVRTIVKPDSIPSVPHPIRQPV